MIIKQNKFIELNEKNIFIFNKKVFCSFDIFYFIVIKQFLYYKKVFKLQNSNN